MFTASTQHTKHKHHTTIRIQPAHESDTAPKPGKSKRVRKEESTLHLVEKFVELCSSPEALPSGRVERLPVRGTLLGQA